MLQGVCEIELRDEHGNVVQKTKDKNMITNAFSNIINMDTTMFLRMYGSQITKEHYNRCLPLLEKMIGGIYLFSETQDESADNVVANLTKLTGCAGLSKKTENHNMLGQWNIEESSIIYNDKGQEVGIKFVFDFATNRSNGVIKSVSLTTDLGARINYETKNLGISFYNSPAYYGDSILYHPNLINPILEINKKNQVDYNLTERLSSTLIKSEIITVTDKGEIVVGYNADPNSKKMTLRKFSIKNKISLNSYFIGSNFIYDTERFDLILEKDIDVSDFYQSSTYFENTVLKYTYFYDNYIYITSAYDKDIKLKKISLDTFDVIENLSKRFEPGGINVGINYSSYNYAFRGMFVYKNYYVVAQYINGESDVNILYINQSDMTIAKKKSFTLYDSTSSKNVGVYKACSCGYVGDYLYITVMFHDGSSSNNSYIYKSILADEELNTIEVKWGPYIPIYQNYFKYPIMLIRRYSDSTYMSSKEYFSSMILANCVKFTIDNLATPVTKTASQTMKVIYTIKDAE